MLADPSGEMLNILDGKADSRAKATVELTVSSSGQTGTNSGTASHEEAKQSDGATKPEEFKLGQVPSVSKKSYSEEEVKLYAILTMAIQEPSLNELIRHVTPGDARGVWQVLLDRYERKSTANKSHVWECLLKSAMEEGESVDSYVARIKNTEMLLLEMQETVPQGMLVHTLMNGLPSSYEVLKQALGLQRDLTFQDIVKHLIDHQEKERLNEKMRRFKEDEGHAYALHHAKSNTRPPKWKNGGRSSSSGSGVHASSNQGKREDRRCFECDKPGHIARNCRSKKPKSNTSDGVKTCFNCGGKGHISPNCPSKKNSQPGTGGRALSATVTSTSEVTEDDYNTALMMGSIDGGTAMALQKSYGSDYVSWIVDSAATTHLCNTQAMLTDMEPLKRPLRLTAANGDSMLIHHRGTSRIRCDSGHSIGLSAVGFDHQVASNLLSVPQLTHDGYNVTFNEVQCEVTDRASGRLIQTIPRIGELYVWTQKCRDYARQPTLGEGLSGTGTGTVMVATTGAAKRKAVKASVPAIIVPVEPKLELQRQAVSGLKLWHYRMGHMGNSGLKKLCGSDAVDGLPKGLITSESKNQVSIQAAETVCDACVLGKSHRASFGTHMNPQVIAEKVGDRIHADLCGPVVNPKATVNEQQVLRSSLDGTSKYILTLIDEKSRKLFVFPLKSKDAAASKIMDWCTSVRVKQGRPIKEFHTDGGREFVNKKCEEYFLKHGITHTVTQKHTPQHNGIVERSNRTLFEMARAMMQHAKLPPMFWCKAILTAVFIRNRSLTTSSKQTDGQATVTEDEVSVSEIDVPKHSTRFKTPEELWSGKRPNLKNIRVFGSDCFVHTPKSERSGKLDAKAHRAVFVGYPSSGVGWNVLDLDRGIVIQSRDVSFNENVFTHRGSILMKAIDMDGAYEDESELETILDNIIFEDELRVTKALSKEVQAQATTVVQEHKSNEQSEVRGQGVSAEAELKQAEAVPPARPVPLIHSSKKSKKNPQPMAKPASVPPISTRSARSSTLAQRSHPAAFSASVHDVNGLTDPRSYTEAMSRPDAAGWREAMEAEIASHARNGTWSLVPKPDHDDHRSRNRIAGNRWVLVTKRDASGRIERLKARLVFKGYEQVYGVNYTDTYAPVLKYKSMRILLVLVARWDYELKQLDVETAYLNATIKEEVYMKQPEGYEVQSEEHPNEQLVCKLNKALYGTKQAGREWNEEVNSFLLDDRNGMGYIRCQSDTCVYIRTSRSGQKMLLGLFVDDIISAYAREDESEWLELKDRLMNKYAVKDKGDAVSLLGMRISRDRSQRTLILDHEHYINSTLESFGMHQCKSVSTPEQVGLKLNSCESTQMNAALDEDASTVTVDDEADSETETSPSDRKLQYQKAVGALNYAAQSTRPDLSHAVNVLSRHLNAPTECHWNAVKRVFRYLRGTAALGLNYRPAEWDRSSEEFPSIDSNELVPVIAFADADWAGDTEDRKSTNGFVVQLFGCSVSWVSKKQATVALSTAEAEYMALSALIQEIMWLHQLMIEIGCRVPKEDHEQSKSIEVKRRESQVRVSVSDQASSGQDSEVTVIQPMTLIWTDNQSAKAMSTNDVHHQRTKHIDIRHHFIRDQIAAKEVRVDWIPTTDQLADIFTKALDRQTFHALRAKIMGECELEPKSKSIPSTETQTSTIQA